MKFNFTIRQLNSSFDDSAVFVRNVYKKRAMLFDCGRLGNLDNTELLDIADVFVTHTHMDHFSGFDRFLRGCLNSNNTIRFFGPEGIIKNIRGKLDGYNWNLIRDYNLTFDVIELSENSNRRTVFAAKNGFIDEPREPMAYPIDLGDGFTLKYDFFDHGIISVGYRVCEPLNISIVKEKLDFKGYLPGAWLKELKKSLLRGDDKDKLISVQTTDGVKDTQIRLLEEEIAEYKRSQDITYITDIAPTFENYSKAVSLASCSVLLIIEAVFLDEDLTHAIEKNHLTIELSRGILKDSGSDYVRFLHFAPRYERVRDIFFKSLNSGISSKLFPL